MIEYRPFMNIVDTATFTGLSQTFIRQGCKDGKIPFVRSGQKYMINVGLLLKTLGADDKEDE